MANPFFNALGSGGNPMNPMQMLSQLRSNPLAMLQKAGYNIPQNLNDPQAIIQHLMNSGQITQQQMNNAQRMANQFGLK